MLKSNIDVFFSSNRVSKEVSMKFFYGSVFVMTVLSKSKIPSL